MALGIDQGESGKSFIYLFIFKKNQIIGLKNSIRSLSALYSTKFVLLLFMFVFGDGFVGIACLFAWEVVLFV